MRRPLFVSVSVVLLLLSSACTRKPDNSKTSGTASNGDTLRSRLASKVEPPPSKGPDADAVAALRQMSDYLSKLNGFELVSNGTLDAVTKSNQRIQVGGVAHYKVKKPG